jgi:hypothetical protein
MCRENCVCLKLKYPSYFPVGGVFLYTVRHVNSTAA